MFIEWLKEKWAYTGQIASALDTFDTDIYYQEIIRMNEQIAQLTKEVEALKKQS